MVRNLGFVVAFLGGVRSARISRSRSSAEAQEPPTTKFVAGVPILNYHLAFGGKASLSEAGEQLGQDWVMVVQSGTSDAEVDGLCKGLKQGCKMVGHPGGGGVPFLEVHGTEKDLEGIVQAAAGAAKFVEPNVEMYVYPDIEVEMGAMSTASWGLERVGAPMRPTQGKGVHIYVVDTGVRSTHRDFGGRAIPTLDVTSGSAVECNGALSCAFDKQGHGTHCAGTTAGTNYGVAPRAQVHSVKVLSDSGRGEFSWSYAALDWIATKGPSPAVASMSLGGEGVLSAMGEAIDAAVAAGVTVVVAGGNFNTDACKYSPAFSPSAITIGSTTAADMRSDFSNYGSCVDLWAPGSDIVSASSKSDTGSKTLSGTSMACPHVSGGVALLLESNPRWSSAQVLSEMLATAVSGGIVGLKSSDTNKLLWVGAGPAPAPTPAVCPSWSVGPDSDLDCRCHYGSRCYENGAYGCTWSGGSRSSSYHIVGCSGCRCK